MIGIYEALHAKLKEAGHPLSQLYFSTYSHNSEHVDDCTMDILCEVGT